MDAIVLAGGKSERLTGIVPPYHKPFLVVDGESLLVRAVNAALRVAERVVVVATGENAMPVWQLVGHNRRVRVILNSSGVISSLAHGLELCTLHRRVLVLMSDNVFAENDIANVTHHSLAIGVQPPGDDFQRFTKFSNGRWTDNHVERKTVTDVWCGPLVIDRIIQSSLATGTGTIADYLNLVEMRSAVKVPVRTIDIGTPEAVAALTRR